MIYDDPVQNSILHRANSKTGRTPFLVPLNDSTSTLTSTFYAPSSKDKSMASRKSIRVLRPDTLKRAANDACMAAAIGDLEWLKQTFKISSEKTFDKDGFSTIHLASIHGRMNILKYLIEEQGFDPNFPSAMHCWYPVHLCISNQIGSRAVECLKFLIEKGADINVKNTDDIYPLHMAASEGQVDCLKILLELKPNANVTDKRGQTPLDLAKLWGHRACAKILSSYMWSQEKREGQDVKKNQNRAKTQEILKEIELAHMLAFPEGEKSEKKFDQWLVDQGFERDENKPSSSRQSKKQTPKLELPFSLVQFENDQKISDSQLELELHEIVSEISSAKKSLLKRKDSKLDLRRAYHDKNWNYSTKPQHKNYVSNLRDFFPRDPYTLLPHEDLILVKNELGGMSLEQVKKFINTKLPKSRSTSVNKKERPVYFKPKNVIDTQAKVRTDEQKLGIDNAGLVLGDDIETFGYKQARDFIENKPFYTEESSVGYYDDEIVKIIQLNSESRYKDDKLEIIKDNCGQNLADFMANRKTGKMSQKYEKVFII